MNAFLEGRNADFRKFRMRNKQELEDYLDGCAKDLNAPPSMRAAVAGKGQGKRTATPARGSLARASTPTLPRKGGGGRKPAP